LPRSAFTRARNALAAERRRAGRAGDSAAVRRLPKPSVAVWVVNQLARRRGTEVEQFVRVVERLRRPSRARSGGMRVLVAEHRRLLQRLLEAARDLLVEAGARPAPPLLSRVSATLVATAADPRARRALREGAISEEPRAPGFEVLAGSSEWSLPEGAKPPEAGPPSGPPSGPPEGGVPRRRSATAAVEDPSAKRAREAERVAAAEMEEADRRARDLERAAAAHEQAAREAVRQAGAIRARLRDAERRAREERESAQQARRAAERARQDAERARTRLAWARQVLGRPAERVAD
jgi:hypothetical protein